MPTKKIAIDPDRWYLARETVSVDNGVLIRAGERRHGDDPLVRDHASWWVPEDDTTPERLAQERAAEQEAVVREISTSQPLPSKGYGTVTIVDAPKKRMFVAVREVYGPDRSGAVERFPIGAQVDADHPILQVESASFRPLEEVFARYQDDDAA